MWNSVPLSVRHPQMLLLPWNQIIPQVRITCCMFCYTVCNTSLVEHKWFVVMSSYTCIWDTDPTVHVNLLNMKIILWIDYSKVVYMYIWGKDNRKKKILQLNWFTNSFSSYRACSCTIYEQHRHTGWSGGPWGLQQVR